jgi:hypothetical protein
MIAIITDRPCNTCGQRHTLCLTDFDHFEQDLYEYDCPVTYQTVRFTAGQGDWDLIDVACPAEHVTAVRVTP